MEKRIVNSISHIEIRNISLKHGIERRHSKSVLLINSSSLELACSIIILYTLDSADQQVLA